MVPKGRLLNARFRISSQISILRPNILIYNNLRRKPSSWHVIHFHALHAGNSHYLGTHRQHIRKVRMECPIMKASFACLWVWRLEDIALPGVCSDGFPSQRQDLAGKRKDDPEFGSQRFP